MAWFALIAAFAVLLIGMYGVVRLRSHETDPLPGGSAGAERPPDPDAAP